MYMMRAPVKGCRVPSFEKSSDLTCKLYTACHVDVTSLDMGLGEAGQLLRGGKNASRALDWREKLEVLLWSWVNAGAHRFSVRWPELP